MLQKLLWLSFAGACGTLSRYGLCELAGKATSGRIPSGTLVVNVLGSFLFGLIYTLVQRKLNISDEVRMILLVGFMGAFTTFSTFAFETARMLKAADWLLAMTNIAAQVILGIAALALGSLAARLA